MTKKSFGFDDENSSWVGMNGYTIQLLVVFDLYCT